MRRRAVALVIVVAVGLGACGDDPAVERAVDVLRDDGRFTSGAHGGQAFARVADLLLADGRACRDDRRLDAQRCERVLAAAGYAHAAAAAVVTCTAAAMEDARRGLAAYLEGDERLPLLPTCA